MTRFIDSPHITRREDFGALLNCGGLTGEAVEVGTLRGEFAVALLDGWRGRRLHCVDPWCANIPGYVGQDSIALGDRDADFADCLARLARHADRVAYHRMMSHEAAPLFPDGSLDFVYLDGNHQYEGITQDLALWWPKVRAPGILAGHDWASDWIHTVQRAVREWAPEHTDVVYLVSGDAWSWYVIKGSGRL